MSEFKGLEGEITFYEDDIRNSISIGENRGIVDVWNFGLTKEEHAELTTTITKALKIRQEINFDLVELLRQRNEMLEALERILFMSEEIGVSGCTYGDTEMSSIDVVFGYNLALENVKSGLSDLIKQATEI